MRSYWEQVREHIGNKKHPTPTPYPKRKKILGLVGACCLTSFVARMFLQVLA